MGYDMFMRANPHDLKSGYQPQFEDQPHYWRFNSGGMRGMYSIMDRAGILDSKTPAPRFPEFPPGLFTPERTEALDGWIVFDEAIDPEPTDHELEVLAAYRSQIHAVQSLRSASKLVAGFKFSSNDGWLVQPDECTILAAGLRAALKRSQTFLGGFRSIVPSQKQSGIGQQEAIEWILNWVAYNETAAECGGYRVK